MNTTAISDPTYNPPGSSATEDLQWFNGIKDVERMIDLDPFGYYVAIDSYVRDFDRKIREWSTLARMAQLVKEKKLWKHGGYSSWSAWVQSAAPACARSVFAAVETYKRLKGDFTYEEMKEMPTETAKVMSELSPGARRDPTIKEASKKSRRKFVRTVQEVRPDQHLEEASLWRFTLTESQRAEVEEEFNLWKAGDDEITDGEILVALCLMSRKMRESGLSV